MAKHQAGAGNDRGRGYCRRNASQAGRLQSGIEAWRGPGANSAGHTSRCIAPVLLHSPRLRHGGDLRMSLASVIRSEDKLLVRTYERNKVLFEKGRGVYLWDSGGRVYLDFLSGIGVNALGHGHTAIQSTLKKQAGKLIHV